MMKKALLSVTIIALGCMIVACARSLYLQQKNATKIAQHLTFVNSPIDGTCADFEQILEGKGFRAEGKRDDTLLMRGNYMGKKDCKVKLTPVVNTDAWDDDKIYMVEVTFENDYHGDRKEVFQHYIDIKDLLTAEFGKENEQEKYASLSPNPCNPMLEFESPEGFVKLGLEKNGNIDLYYIDKLNAALNNSRKETTNTLVKCNTHVSHSGNLVYQS